MGQKASTAREFTPDTKPPKKENNFSLEKPKNENEENEFNARESLKATQKELGVSVIIKDSEMALKMESFIIDAIIVEKLKHSGNFNEIARAIIGKLQDQYGGGWNVFIAKEWNLAESGFVVRTIRGAHIQLTYESHLYFVFKST